MSAPFTSQEYQALLQELESLADPQYKAFHEGLIPGVSMAWGVRLPALRAAPPGGGRGLSGRCGAALTASLWTGFSSASFGW